MLNTIIIFIILYFLFNFIRVNFVASSHSSIAMMENKDYILFIDSLNPNYSLPSRKKLHDLILEQGEKIKEEVHLKYFLKINYSIVIFH